MRFRTSLIFQFLLKPIPIPIVWSLLCFFYCSVMVFKNVLWQVKNSVKTASFSKKNCLMKINLVVVPVFPSKRQIITFWWMVLKIHPQPVTIIVLLQDPLITCVVPKLPASPDNYGGRRGHPYLIIDVRQCTWNGTFLTVLVQTAYIGKYYHPLVIDERLKFALNRVKY